MPPLDATQADDWVTAPAATANAGKDDWITAPAPASIWLKPAGGEFRGEFGEQSVPPDAPQTSGKAFLNSVAQGAVGGIGTLVGGAGDIANAGNMAFAKQAMAALDLVDAGKKPDAYLKQSMPLRQQIVDYRNASPEVKVAQRAMLQQTIDEYDKPNMAQRAGTAIDNFSTDAFPVDPKQEGHLTGAGRMVGSVAPLVLAGALGGPAGIAASSAAIGAQAFHGARADAIANGATPDEADSAAGKSAFGQIAAMSVPISKVLPLIPMSLREGFVKTLVNVGQRGVELGAGNTLATVAQNYVARMTYDPTRPVFKGTDDAGVDGFLAGLVIHGAGAAAGAVRRNGVSDNLRPAIADIGAATDIDGAISAAARAAQTPGAGGTTAPLSSSGDGWRPVGATEVFPAGRSFRMNVTTGLSEVHDPGWTPSTGGTTAPGWSVDDRFGVPPKPAERGPAVGGWGDLFAPKPSNADEVKRAAFQARQTEASGLDTAVPELPVSGANPYMTIPPEPKRLIQFLREPVTTGSGIHAVTTPGGLRDFGGDIDAAIGGPKGRPGLINNADGQHLDAATQRAWDAGYFPEHDTRPDINVLLDAIREDHAGTPRYSVHDLEAADAHNVAHEHNVEIDNIASQTGINTRGVTRDQFFDALADHLSQQDHATVQASVDAAHQEAFDKAMAAGKGEGADNRTIPSRSLAELEDAYRQEDAARATLGGPANDARSGPVAANAGAGEAGGGPGGRVAGDAGRGGTQAGAAGQPSAGAVGNRGALDASDAEAAAGGWRRLAPGEPRSVGMEIATDPRNGREYVKDTSVPQSVGAAASRDMTNPALADISTADMKANRRVAEQGEILEPPQANDTMIHVPGSFPTLAERSGDPAISQYENLLRQRNPDLFIGDGKILTENNKARVAEFARNTVPDTTLVTMRRDRDARFAKASDVILPAANPADLTPVQNWIQEELGKPRIRENDAVRSILEDFQDRIIDGDGDLKSDPAAVWGIHDHLQNLLAKAKDPLNATGAEKFAQSQILKMKHLIDQAMNVATDNRFQSALDRYADDSKAINAGVVFNDFWSKLTNMSGELQAANFHNFVKGLAKERGNPGIDPSMDISDQGMRSMINIDKDLKRAGLIKLGSAAGSPTNLLGALAEKAGLNAAHGIVGKIPLAGGLLVEGQKYLAQRKLIADTQRHIAPPEGGYTYPEP